jgi:uncharacterized protein YqgC (DUF456 family)
MVLPVGTIRALKDAPDALVTVVIAAMALGALAEQAPVWPTMVVVLVTLGIYHVRRSAAEAHAIRVAELKVDEAAAKVDAVRARHMAAGAYVEGAVRLGLPGATVRRPRRGE